MTKHTVGIDISKDRLDACRATDGSTEWFSNDSAGFEGLISWMTGSRAGGAARGTSELGPPPDMEPATGRSESTVAPR